MLLKPRLSNGVFSIIGLFLFSFLLALISGTTFLSVSNSSAESTEVDIVAHVTSVLSITTNAPDSELTMPLTPTPSGTLVKNGLTVTVSTNNPTGYSLSMNSETTNTSLVHANATGSPPSPNIPSTTHDYTAAATLAGDTWGWNLGAPVSVTTFMKIPPSDATRTIRTTNEPSSSSDPILSNTLVTFGANVTDAMSAGRYTNTIVFTATTNFVPPPPVIPPAGSYPTNISSTNPGIRDVYPTTGWGGEVIIITGDNLFTNVQSVTIGGTDCNGYNVISTSVIACRLPAKPHGSTNDIAVMNGASPPGTNVTNAATYKHMKVTYFNPSQTTITFADTTTFGSSTFTYYPGTNPSNTFSSTDCAALTPNNTNAVDIPNSIVFVRDTRNKQVYKVKKMADEKCWMTDNLKYQGSTDRDGTPIQNYDGAGGTAGSTGMTYRNEDNTHNTIDGSSTQSATNSNKAFWNNQMGWTACYSGVYPIMAANTLTHCGYLYNWFAATGGTGTYDTDGMDIDGNQATSSICPANFRLPSGRSGTEGPTTNGTSTTTADFPVLNASMNAGFLTTGATTSTFFAGWQPSAQWAGVRAANWLGGGVGSDAAYWSSTYSYTAGDGRATYFYDNYVGIGTSFENRQGLAVRCVL